jgi:hypothetical protein
VNVAILIGGAIYLAWLSWMVVVVMAVFIVSARCVPAADPFRFPPAVSGAR